MAAAGPYQEEVARTHREALAIQHARAVALEDQVEVLGVGVGVLTDGGEVYLLLDDHNNPDPYDSAKKLAGERAEISGKKFNKQGVNSIVVDGTKGL